MKKYALIIITVILFTACSKEKFEQQEFRASGFILKMKPEILTRATEDGDNLVNENKITSINVFFFPHSASDSDVCLHSEAHNGLSFNGTSTFQQELTTIDRTAFTAGATYDIYLIANLPSDVVLPNPITLGALKSLHTISAIVGNATQPSIVMDSRTTAVVNPTVATPIVYVTMPLKRALSKIRLKFSFESGSPVTAATTAAVSLKNYALRSSVMDGFPYSLLPADYSNTSYVNATPTSTFTFYSYENNWGGDTNKESYLMVNMPYGTHTSNYYRVAINKYALHSESGKLERNRIYDITAYIGEAGSDSEGEAVTVGSDYTIANWTTKDVILKTVNQHYLGISEYSISMANVATYTLNYVSDLPISIIGVTAKCSQYNTDGSTTQITYNSSQSQFPTFTINSAASTITINSTIPINYVPKYMTFTVTNNVGLSLNATIVQYPTRYVTARYSTGNVKPVWNTDPAQTNFNLFTVNTLVPSSNGSYTLGDPTNGMGKTDSLANGNKMVSPRFLIASQYGIYTSVNYLAAQNRCSDYGEDIYRTGWRIPTKAEIELINAIQDDPNSSVKKLLAGTAYWSAFQYNFYDFTNNVWSSTDAAGLAFIRCVYDVYKDEQ